MLLAAWVLLWAFFVIAVISPAARLHHTPRTAPGEVEVELVTTPAPISRG
jgi:hypothetical protein